MPTYEYECQKCKRHHEVFQSITARPLSRCPRPNCDGRLKRLLGSGSGFLFKGSGFYITDYRSKSYREAKKKDEGGKKDEKDKAASGTSSSTEQKTDSKK